MSTRGCLLIVAIVLCPVLMGCASVPRTPPIDIRFTVVKPSLDLSVSSVKARATTDSIVFTFGYEISQDRTLHLFDPPNGSIFMKTANAPASGRFVSVTISKVDLERVSEVTANFIADGTDVNGFVFLTFSDIAPLLGKSIASGQASGRASGQPDSAQYRTLLSAPGKLEIVRAPAPADFTGMQGKEKAGSPPVYNPGSNSVWQVDIRSCDLSALDLAGRLNDLVHASFDSRTIWPARLPAGFDPAATMALGKNPGLGIRALHARGVTGRGVGIAIIDQALLTDHAEYGNRLKLYEEIHQMPSDAQMHAPAVASIAVGNSVGVAPEADLYFIAEWHAKANASGGFDFALEPLASAIDRIVAVNKTLPSASKIRVISISLGINDQMGDYELARRSIEAAMEQGIYVAYVGSDPYMGMGRDPMADPDSFDSWKAGQFWAGGGTGSDQIMIPMDARCTASPTGTSDYVFYSEGGMSWTVPWVAGLYALACQVKPSVTRREFWATAAATAVTNNAGFGKIMNPGALIAALQERN
jgi:hypothetical protein